MISVSGFFISLFCIVAVAQCKYCNKGKRGMILFNHAQCTYGCCGTWPNEYCCGVYTWVIVVSVVAGILILSCIVTAICYAVKRHGNMGHQVPPAPGGATVTYTSSGAQQVNYGQSQPLAYGNKQSQPPAFGHQHPQPLSNGHPAPSPYPVPGQPGEDPAYPPKSSAPASNPHKVLL